MSPTWKDRVATHVIATLAMMGGPDPHRRAKDACDHADALATEACRRWGHAYAKKGDGRLGGCERCGLEPGPTTTKGKL